MILTIGILIGLAIAGIIFVILTYFRSQIEHTMEITEKRIEKAGPKPKGEIFMPADEATLSREQIIRRNKEQGKDTPISELQ